MFYISLPDGSAQYAPLFISDTEFVYKDSYGGVTLYNAENLTTKVLMTNSTFVSIPH